jgi:hypothetical protein
MEQTAPAPMSRWRAAGTHLALSAIVAIAVVSLLLLVWYPGPLYEASGGGRLTFLLIAIDVVVGPVLTLLVFKAGKPGMKFDLAVIAILQLAFLAYGLSVISAARPAFVVFAIDRFVAVSANQLTDERLAEASDPAYARAPWTGPVRVAAKRPTDPGDEDRVLTSFLAGGGDLERFPKFYEPYEARGADAGARARPLAELREKKDAAAIVDAFIARHPDADNLGWLPLVARSRDMTAVIRKDTGEWVDVLPIDPW